MTLDVRGSIKNTKLSKNPYVVFEELISNAIDSYLIRKHDDPTAPSLSIRVDVAFQKVDLLDDRDVMTITCADNGCGLGEAQLKAFLTKDTSYKDDLTISGIGKCKGAGRIQFFHYFAGMAIDSTFRRDGQVFRRWMTYDERQKQIEADDFAEDAGDASKIGTTIQLLNFKDAARVRLPPNALLSAMFSAAALKKQMLLAFLQRLVGLSSQLGDFEIVFSTTHWAQPDQTEVLRRQDLPVVTAVREVQVEERDPDTGGGLGTFQTFRLSHYRLDAASFGLKRNAIAFCAKFSPVRDITNRYLRSKTEQNNPVGGYNHIVLIESDFLDQHVNEQRDNFEDIPEELEAGGLFGSERVSYETIHAAIDPVIDAMVIPGDWKKEDVVKEITDKYGVTEDMLQETSTRVVYGESAQKIVDRVLKKYQEKVIDETAEIYRLKEEIVAAEPDSADFRKKISEISWKYTTSLKNFDMANLSQLVVRRACIVEVLALACGRNLSVQNLDDGARRKDERIIHSIFFPMRQDSTEVTDHDIWLLSEEYHYYDYIASDMPLANIVWNSDEKVFENDIDQAFKDLLARRAQDHGAKRPDIALFSKEGSAIIVEFKAPGVSMDDHVGDLNQYAHLLAAKSGGRIKRFYGYLIGDTLDPLRLNGWTPFPTGKGWFNSDNLIDPTTRTKLGETYFEILHFDDVVDRARKRIGVYQDKLKFSIPK
ncbi:MULTISPECIES: hypothetical protein [Caulobacter]|jgi:hypothetical protein|uniref:Histidine kinase/HSP90-like ATPase domain-containing protein n=1 Tax=Caulobacter vibrioides OR37 TaxID=1292034 RepID=R0CZ98_CAUVI|nr:MULTISPECIES: hypothetical protein [Caulobacter]ENZ81585.1 hypothetical protein OR37_02523 [Caulobacter vibrioides OR37]PIB96974.1 hypothetical protein CSW60_21065 [Caulobacter sp. X]